jgi:hypothetical protein
MSLSRPLQPSWRLQGAHVEAGVPRRLSEVPFLWCGDVSGSIKYSRLADPMKNACLATRAILTAQAAALVRVFQWDNECRRGETIESAFWGGSGGTNPECLFKSAEFCKHLFEHRGLVILTTDGEIDSGSVDCFGQNMSAMQVCSQMHQGFVPKWPAFVLHAIHLQLRSPREPCSTSQSSP